MSAPDQPNQPKLPAEVREAMPKPPQHLAGVSGNMVETKADAALTPSEPPPSVAEPTSEGWTRISVPPQPSAFAEKDAEIARLNNQINNLLKPVRDRLIEERNQLRAEVHGWRLIHAEPDKVVQELNQLRAEVEQWKTTAAKDREENVDMRNEIADLRAQLAEIQRVNQADYTEAGWQRARELETQLASLEASERKAHYEREDARQALELCRTELASAQEDKERLLAAAEELERSAESAATYHNIGEMDRALKLVRAAIVVARKEARHE